MTKRQVVVICIALVCCVCGYINSHFRWRLSMEYCSYCLPQWSTFSPACYVCVTYAVKSFVIYPSALPPKHEITPDKQLARDFQTIQCSWEKDSARKKAVRVLTKPTVCEMLYMVNFLMNLLSCSGKQLISRESLCEILESGGTVLLAVVDSAKTWFVGLWFLFFPIPTRP